MALERLRSVAGFGLAVLDRALFVIGGVLLTGIVVIIFLQTFYRYVLNDSLTWTDEMARLLLVWLVWFGAGLAALRARHLRLSILVERLAPARGRILRTIIELAVLTLMVVLIGQNQLVIEVRAGMPFTSFPLSSKYLNYSLTVGAALVGLGSAVALLREWWPDLGKKRPSN